MIFKKDRFFNHVAASVTTVKAATLSTYHSASPESQQEQQEEEEEIRKVFQGCMFQQHH